MRRDLNKALRYFQLASHGGEIHQIITSGREECFPLNFALLIGKSVICCLRMRLAAWIRTGLRMLVFPYMYTTVRAQVPSNSASNSQVSSQPCITLRARVSFAIIASPDNCTAAWLARKHTQCGEQGSLLPVRVKAQWWCGWVISDGTKCQPQQKQLALYCAQRHTCITEYGCPG